MLIVFALFLLFLFIGLYYQNNLFLIFAFACSIIIVYELSNSGMEYPTGTNTTISKINDSVTKVDTTYSSSKVTSFWITPLIVIFAIISLALIWQAIVGFGEENE